MLIGYVTLVKNKFLVCVVFYMNIKVIAIKICLYVLLNLNFIFFCVVYGKNKEINHSKNKCQQWMQLKLIVKKPNLNIFNVYP